jgi:hypothetical protein
LSRTKGKKALLSRHLASDTWRDTLSRALAWGVAPEAGRRPGSAAPCFDLTEMAGWDHEQS